MRYLPLRRSLRRGLPLRLDKRGGHEALDVSGRVAHPQPVLTRAIKHYKCVIRCHREL